MAYELVNDFKAGQDNRRSRDAGVPGALWRLTNAHINRGGEIERAKKFVPKWTLPAGTFGLQAANGQLFTFGSVSDPGVGSATAGNITYQRLQHPDGSTAMTAVTFSNVFDSKPYVIAQFADGKYFHYYNGAIVEDWIAGVVRSDMTNNAGIATHLGSLFSGDADYSAAVVSNVVTVTGPVGADFTPDSAVVNGGATDDQTLNFSVTQAAVAAISEVLSTAAFNITGGSGNTAATGSVTLTGGASGNISSITVGGTEILGATVNFNTDLTTTATAVKNQINAYTGTSGYTATSSGAVITITGPVATGADINGLSAVVTEATITSSITAFSGGVTNAVTSVTVDGVEVLGTRVNWTSSNSVTAANVATQISTYTSSPDYTASSSVGKVTVSGATGSGTTPNGKIVSVTTVGSVTVTGSGTAMAGGVAAAAGQAKKVAFTVGGTFEVGDKFTIKLTKNSVLRKFGAEGNPEQTGVSLTTLGGKIYSVINSLLFFSAASSAVHWNRDDTLNPGANFINLAQQDEGSQQLIGCGVFQGNLAAFSRSNVQFWSVNADPSKNVFLQVVKNTGARAARSILEYGNLDLFYLSDAGVRSIRPRDASSAPSSSNVGVAIDPFMVDYMRGLSSAQIDAAVSVIEPLDDRYWLAMGNYIFVFSSFPTSQISAWSYYDLGTLSVDSFARIVNQLYVRMSDSGVYLYGGDDGQTYPDAGQSVVTVALPFLSANAPGTPKNMEAFGMAAVNVWDVSVLIDPKNESVAVNVGSINGTNYSQPMAAAQDSVNMWAPVLMCSRAGYAKLSNLAIFYTDPNATPPNQGG
jgi:hypothetical protein